MKTIFSYFRAGITGCAITHGVNPANKTASRQRVSIALRELIESTISP
jgi:hypothetical protein